MAEQKRLWSIIEIKLKTKFGHDSLIPKYIKNILNLNGFDNMCAFAKLDDEIINKLEIFARVEMIHVIDERVNPKDYFHIYTHRNFKFVIGHRILLKEISLNAQQYIKQQISNY